MEINQQQKRELLETLKGFIHFVQDPAQTTSVFEIQRGLSHQPISLRNVEYMLSNSAIKSLADEQYQPPRPSLTELIKLPESSLGYCYAKSLLDAGFDPDFFEPIDVIGPGTYLDLRVRQTHDIWHIMTGFGTDLAGEVGLQAFQLSQIYSPLSVLISAAGILHCMTLGLQLDPVLAAIHQGIEISQTKVPMLSVKWEEHWDVPVNQLREMLGLKTACYTPVFQ